MNQNISMRRFAVLDIGTVTCRMLVADVDPNNIIHEITREYAIANLGEGVDATHRLKPEAIERVAKIVMRYLQILESLEGSSAVPTRIVALATSASRDAENAGEFEARLRELGVTLQVIPGTEEASLSFRGATAEFPDENVIVIDVGGGSTEVIAGSAGCDPAFIHSFDIGCRRVTERFLASDPPATIELASARSWIRAQMEPLLEPLCKHGDAARLVAVAGTATSVVSIREKMEVYDRTRVHKAQVSRLQLQEIGRRLASIDLEQRRKVQGLDPDRAPVIVAGLLILDEIMGLFQAESFTASESDILQGVVLRAAVE